MAGIEEAIRELIEECISVALEDERESKEDFVQDEVESAKEDIMSDVEDKLSEIESEIEDMKGMKDDILVDTETAAEEVVEQAIQKFMAELVGALVEVQNKRAK